MRAWKQWVRPRAVSLKNAFLYRARFQLDVRLRAITGTGRRVVTYATYAGLANRLRAHFIAAAIADLTGRELVPVWLSTKELASDGSDVLANAPTLEDRRLLRTRPVRMLSCADGAHLVKRARMHSSSVLALDFDAQWISIRDARATLGRTAPVSIAVRGAIDDEANQIMSGWRGRTLAVHIRQTDFVSHTPFARSVAEFEAEISRRPTGYSTLLIASDGPVVLSTTTRDRFEHVQVIQPTLARTEPGVAPEAMAHVLALARADDFIGSPMSSFSELVSAIRDAVVTVVPT